VKPASPLSPSSGRSQLGFTLLELTIAMSFVALLAAGISISIATCLNVWRRSLEQAEVSQEARAVMALLSRDLRGAYLGLQRDRGYFIGLPAEPGDAPFDSLELCTEDAGPSRVSLLPDELRAEWDQELRPPITDYAGVSYQWLPEDEEGPAGLYRSTVVAPIFGPELAVEAAGSELISANLMSLEFNYFDGEAWRDQWDSREEGELPALVSVDFVLCDARQQDHVFQTIVPIAMQ
jgi:type II secretory pathway pseudopilin PulG